jgi:general secretion pathway protein A
MYAKYFGLKQEPFSIAPDPRYLFMSERHREALAHLLYGVDGGGGFVLLSGEIGAGKTTVCRCFLEQIPRRCNVAYIFNPKLTVQELLHAICDEFRIPYEHTGPGVPTVKDYLDPLNEYLLRTHAVGQNNVLIIDEAQQLSVEVLEQLRLLTNLETSERKLLQIILIGQPELRSMLARPELEQLAQRVIARFHLEALTETETLQYIRHRLAVAGLRTALPFERKARRRIHQLSRGVPRRINLLCDRALLGTYAEGRPRVEVDIVDKAALEVFGPADLPARLPSRWRQAALVGAGVAAGAALFGVISWTVGMREPAAVARAAVPASAPPAASASAAAAPARLASAAPVDLKAQLPALARTENDAWRALAPAWKLALAPDADPCDAAQRQQVLCFRSNAGLSLIRQLGRPGVLTLRDEQDRPVYALLTGLGEQAATLRVNGVSQVVPLTSLASRWRGDFATFWRAPDGYSTFVRDGQAGAVVDRLAAQLAAVHGEPAPAAGRTLDAALKSRVMAFQLAQGLKADGVPGATTFMQLNRATGVDEPRLQADAAPN